MSFRLLHFSDPHFGAFNPQLSREAVEIAREIAPDMTFVSGDFSMRGRKFEFVLAKEWLSRLPQPMLSCPGNHDVPGLNHIVDRFFSPFRRYRKYISEIEEPTAKLGTVGAICTANSSTPFGLHLDWSRGFLSPIQLHAMNEFFSGLPADQLRIFGIHHPLLGSGTKERALVSPMPLVKKSLVSANVDLVLTGHFHQSRIGLFPEEKADPEKQGHQVIVSQAPSICSTRLKGEPNGFHLLTLDHNRIEIELWRWSLERFLPERSRIFEKENGLWKSVSPSA
ncbi:metallophosphoesterase family protein [Luteolibacter algae]|uniref:Metallophosphoesterase family protein n=1 Tax=Luteolibacter algae TaxID=454151 RepID=A0ABW5DAK6_9BACT